MANAAPTQERLASVQEVAKYLGVPPGTLYQWRHVGTGPRGYRVGRYVRYRWSDVEEWLDGQASDSST